MALICPTIRAIPMLDQPPLSVNWVKTTEAELRGARTQNMTMICRNRKLDVQCKIMIITYSEESEYVNNEHDVLEHRHSPSTVDVAKVHDECDRPDLAPLVIDKSLPKM